MTPIASLARVSALLTLAVVAGCAASTDAGDADAPTGDSISAISASKVRLPVGDPCRDVLAPLSLGLADGSVGLSYAKSITVSLTSETDTRAYTVAIASASATYRYAIELDNDSHSKCLLTSVTPDRAARLDGDRRSSATARETRATAPVRVSPANDDCTSTVKLLGQAAAVSAVGAANIVKVDVTLDSETEDRDYVAHVDGRSFVANGKTFANDATFNFNLSNDSASKCFVQGVTQQ